MAWTRSDVRFNTPMEQRVGFARAVRVGPVITVGGCAAVAQDGSTVGVGDVAAQTRRCIEVAAAALKEAGADLSHVTRTRTLLVDIKYWETAADIRREAFGDTRPVETIMAVSGFVNPEWLVEMEFDAVIPGG
ncbi:Rid family hydrolase [Rhodovulum sp. DZ06]|uniref:Rid family hydrolase n=1 Tax=Rhodovulum sp. DZ06 TaxID=3425126 RepID=UPI003D34D2E1